MAILSLTFRLILAIVFAIAGIAKLADLKGSRKSLGDFGVPRVLAAPFSVLLPLAELSGAAALLSHTTARWGAAALAGLLILFIGGIAVNLARGRRPDCHCFGQLSSAPVSVKTLVRNAALLAIAAWVAWTPAIPISSAVLTGDSGRIEPILILLLSILTVAILLTWWFLFHLLRQYGRMLVRLESLESKSGIASEENPAAGLAEGTPAPDVRFTTLDGEGVSLDQLGASGKTLLLVFTEPSCGACDELLPDISKWQIDHRDRLAVIPVSRGTAEANRSKYASLKLSGVLLEKEREASQAFRVAATPSAVLIADHKIASALAVGPDRIRELVARATLPPPLKKGDRLPGLRLPDLGGEYFELESLRGRRSLMLFWSPTCGFCGQMLDDLKKWESNRRSGTPELIVISSGSADANREQGLRSRVLLDAQFKVGRMVGAEGTPSAVLVDEQGKLASAVEVGASAVLGLARSSY